MKELLIYLVLVSGTVERPVLDYTDLGFSQCKKIAGFMNSRRDHSKGKYYCIFSQNKLL